MIYINKDCVIDVALKIWNWISEYVLFFFFSIFIVGGVIREVCWTTSIRMPLNFKACRIYKYECCFWFFSGFRNFYNSKSGYSFTSLDWTLYSWKENHFFYITNFWCALVSSTKNEQNEFKEIMMTTLSRE